MEDIITKTDEKRHGISTANKVNDNALTKDWKKLENGVMILAGNVSQAHKKFKGHNQQSAAIAIVACAFAYLKNMKTWIVETLDKIITTGDNLYLATRQKEGKRCKEHLTPLDIYKKFYLGRIQVTMKILEDRARFKLEKDPHMLDNLEKSFISFFTKHSYGILIFNDQYYTFWVLNTLYFLFTSNDNNKDGEKWTGVPGLGFSNLLRFPILKQLLFAIIYKSSLKQTNVLTLYPCKVVNFVKINTTPPEKIESQAKLPDKVKSLSIVGSRIIQEPTKVKVEVGQGETVPPKPQIEPTESMVPPQRPHLQSVTNFKEVVAGKFGILRGSFHQNDPNLFKLPGHQGLANALVALCMLRVYKSKHWHRDIVNKILKIGQMIHHETLNLPKGEIPENVTIDEKRYRPKVIACGGGVGVYVSTDPNILSLEQAMFNYFVDNDCAILIGVGQFFAIWKEENRFYFFNPNECDETGNEIPGRGGVACVLWFSEIKHLVSQILSNMLPSLHKEHFFLNYVVIEDRQDLADDWFNFKPLALEKWILRGSFSQKDRRFSEESRNTQCTAMCAMALAFKEVLEEKNWTSDVVDDILVKGDEYYQACVDYLQSKNLFKEPLLMVDELKRSFDVDNKRFSLEIDDCLVNGTLNAKANSEILDLQNGIKEFFQNGDGGIVTANTQSMAIWKKEHAYYYFDSHCRDKEGIKCAFGAACVLRLYAIDELTKILLTNVGADRLNLYNISRIIVKVIDLTDDGIVKPPLYNYESLNDYVAILRANITQRDKKFDFLNIGRQTVASCLSGLAMNLLIPSAVWKSEDLDQVLVFGDGLFTKSMEAIYQDETLSEDIFDEISSKNVEKELKIGTNLFRIEFEEYSSGNFEDNLKDALESLDQRREADGDEIFQALFESNFLTVALWRDEHLYYLFDPQERDEKGQVYGKDEWSVKIEETEEEKIEEQEDDDRPPIENDDEENVEGQIDYEQDVEQEEEKDEVEPKIEKKGSYFWKWEARKLGKPCILRFSRLEDLLGHVVDNSPPTRRSEIDFTLTLVKITNTPITHDVKTNEEVDDMTNDWNGFSVIDYGRWILRGTRTMNDKIFLEINRGKQEIPMCLVALGSASTFAMKSYKPVMVDIVMAYGDKLLTVLKRLRFKELKNNKEVHLTEVEIDEILKNANFNIDNYPVQICIWKILFAYVVELGVVNGDITSTIPEAIPNVSSSLTTFFDNHIYAILQCKEYTVAVWKKDDFFYMFDPHQCGPSGHRSPVGTACITRFAKTDDLAEVFVKNLPKIGEHFFVIHSLEFVHVECPRDFPKISENREPLRLGGFHAVTLGKQILRGSVKHRITNFYRGVNNHSAAIAFVALGVSLIKDPLTWTKLVVDEILKLGEDLYYETIQTLDVKFDIWSDILGVLDVNHDFRVGTMNANWVIRDKELRGLVDVKNQKKILNLRQAIEQFFEEYTHGILLVQRLILPIWETIDDRGPHIYLYDPNSRSPTGLPTHGGFACVARFDNAKIAADHVMACLLDEDKSLMEYVILPVEIIVGKKKNEKKKTKKKICDVTTTPNKKFDVKPIKVTPLTCQKRKYLAAETKSAKRIVQEEKLKKEERRLSRIGRDKMYQINDNEGIVRGVRPLHLYNDIAVNFMAFFFLNTDAFLDFWKWSDIEMILQSAQLIHIDSLLTYKPPNQILNIAQVLRTFNCNNVRVKLKVHKPLRCDLFTRTNVLEGLNSAFFKMASFLLSYRLSMVTLMFRSGYYYLFDPYGRDVNGNRITEGGEEGCAMMMRFGTLEALVDKLIFNLTGDEEIVHYTLVFLQIEY